MARDAFKITFRLRSWKSSPDEYVANIVRPLLNALCSINLLYLRNNPRTPSIYAGGVRYTREEIGEEEWQDIPSILENGKADCEDLACARVAELRAQGVPLVRPIVKRIILPQSPERTLFHVLVGVGAKREDPSKLLGM